MVDAIVIGASVRCTAPHARGVGYRRTPCFEDRVDNFQPVERGVTEVYPGDAVVVEQLDGNWLRARLGWLPLITGDGRCLWERDTLAASYVEVPHLVPSSYELPPTNAASALPMEQEAPFVPYAAELPVAPCAAAPIFAVEPNYVEVPHVATLTHEAPETPLAYEAPPTPTYSNVPSYVSEAKSEQTFVRRSYIGQTAQAAAMNLATPICVSSPVIPQRRPLRAPVLTPSFVPPVAVAYAPSLRPIGENSGAGRKLKRGELPGQQPMIPSARSSLRTTGLSRVPRQTPANVAPSFTPVLRSSPATPSAPSYAAVVVKGLVPTNGAATSMAAGPAPLAGAAPAPAPAPALLVGAEEDGPGEYVVVHHNTAVGPDLVPTDRIVANLPNGARVIVAELRNVPEKQRLRGRILDPPGWISLLNTQKGYRYAEKVLRAAGKAASLSAPVGLVQRPSPPSLCSTWGGAMLPNGGAPGLLGGSLRAPAL